MDKLKGFGVTFDLQQGTSRHWYVGEDGVKRWRDNDSPVQECRCSMRQKLVGDGCAICNPEYAEEMARGE